METKVVVAGAIGAGVGALQTPVLRQFVDKKHPLTNIPRLKGFGTPSALIGMIGGGAGLTVGAVGMSKGKDGRQRLADQYIEPAIDYGIVALVGGILSGLYPAVTEADCVAKGGYWYDGACHKTPKTGTTSMDQPDVQMASRPYIPPVNVQQPSVDINLLKQMSTEIQRLSQENAQLKTQTMLEPGTVASKQAEYGFMDPETGTMFVPGQPTKPTKEFGFMDPARREGIAPQHLYNPGAQLTPARMYVPGQPTRESKRYGFMDGGTTPVAQVQQMKSKFDFSG